MRFYLRKLSAMVFESMKNEYANDSRINYSPIVWIFQNSIPVVSLN